MVSCTVDLPTYKELFERIENSQKKGNPVLLTGIRGSGKSTFVKKFLKSRNGLFLDTERILKESEGNISRRTLEEKVGTRMKQNSSGDGECFWIVVDEIQLLRYYGHIGGKDLVKKFYTELIRKRNLGFVFSTSEKGMAENFLRIGSDEKNNSFEIVDIPSLSSGESTYFAKQLLGPEVSLNNEDLEIIFNLSQGVAGWIAVAAEIKRKQPSINSKDLANIFVKQASSLTLSQLKKLSVNSERYTTLMILIANGKNKWSSLKKAMHMSGDLISDTRLGALLNTLNKSGFIDFQYISKKKHYHITDPVIEFILKKLLN